MRHIVAIGGLTQVPNGPNRQIQRYLLRLSHKPRPKVCFIPTASGESRERIMEFFEMYSPLSCVPSWLSLFKPPTKDLDSFVLEKDIIFVGGGNTRSMIALWREWRLDTILLQAYEAGIILSGSSAGANCWFQECTTDSIPGDLTVMNGLGFLPGSFTPHYDVEPDRRPKLHEFLKSGSIQRGYAADNDTALHFADGGLETALSARPEANVYRVHFDGERIIEERTETTRL